MKKKHIWIVSALLVLGLATTSFSLPLPLMLARTQVAPTIMTPVGVPDAHQIEGMVVHYEDFAVTTDADTTATMYVGGLIPWRIINESGGDATLTFYDARTLDGNELTLYDQDDVAVPALTIGDDESMELPTGMSGCTWLIVKGGGAASGFTLVCRR